MYAMSQVQICACTRIGIWQMYTIGLLSEMVYKVYETAEDSQPDLPGMRQQEVTFEKGHKKSTYMTV